VVTVSDATTGPLSDAVGISDASSEPDVAVIMAAYNCAHHVEVALESLCAQTLGLDRMQIIAVDDGSTDETGAVLDRFAAQHPSFTALHQAHTGGPAAPRNRALRLARARYVFFLDADDYLAPDALEAMIAAADTNGTDVVLARVVGVGGREAPRSMFRESMQRTSVFESRAYWTLNPMKMFRRELIERLDLSFPTHLPWGEDQPFVAAAYLGARGLSILADKDYVFWSFREDGLNISKVATSLSDRMPVVETMFDFVASRVPESAERDRLMRRHFHVELVCSAFPAFRREPAAEAKHQAFERFRELVTAYCTPRIRRSLTVFERVLLHLVAENRFDEFCEYLEFTDYPGTPRVQAEGAAVYLCLPWFRDAAHRIPDELFDVARQARPLCVFNALSTRDGALQVSVRCGMGVLTDRITAVDLVLAKRGTTSTVPLPIVHSQGADGTGAGVRVDCTLAPAALLGDAVDGGVYGLSLGISVDGCRKVCPVVSDDAGTIDVSTHLVRGLADDGPPRSMIVLVGEDGALSARVVEGAACRVAVERSDRWLAAGYTIRFDGLPDAAYALGFAVRWPDGRLRRLRQSGSHRSYVGAGASGELGCVLPTSNEMLSLTALSPVECRCRVGLLPSVVSVRGGRLRVTSTARLAARAFRCRLPGVRSS
jgi:glycosyltransferase involved in cell wall biosynthesis